MEEIRLTSWYGESTTIYRGFTYLNWCRISSINSSSSLKKKHPVLIFDGQTAPCIFSKAFFPIRDDVSQLLGNYHKEDRKFTYFQVDVS